MSSYFNQLKVILEHGRNFSFMKHFAELLGKSRDNSSFSRNTISVYKLYFESPLSLLELLSKFKLLLHEPCQELNTIKKFNIFTLEIILFYWPKYLTS